MPSAYRRDLDLNLGRNECLSSARLRGFDPAPAKSAWPAASADCMFSSMIAMHPAVQAPLDLLATSLADVRFADVDGPSLARWAAEVEAAAQSEAVARSALDAANLALQEKQEALLQQAQRALAYAQVYAESDTPSPRRSRRSVCLAPRVVRPWGTRSSCRQPRTRRPALAAGPGSVQPPSPRSR